MCFAFLISGIWLWNEDLLIIIDKIPSINVCLNYHYLFEIIITFIIFPLYYIINNWLIDIVCYYYYWHHLIWSGFHLILFSSRNNDCFSIEKYVHVSWLWFLWSQMLVCNLGVGCTWSCSMPKPRPLARLRNVMSMSTAAKDSLTFPKDRLWSRGGNVEMPPGQGKNSTLEAPHLIENVPCLIKHSYIKTTYI